MKTLFISLFCVLFTAVSCTKKLTYSKEDVKLEYAEIQDKNDIHPFLGKSITPYIYRKVISLRKLPVKEKKQKFIEMLLPAILVSQHELNQNFSRIAHIEKWMKHHKRLLVKDSLFVYGLFEQYKCDEIDQLKIRLKPHPASIVLGQAALESGWGSSRFFVKANNVFGIWSYHSGENRIKALIGRDSTKIYVRSYPNIEESIKDYYQTIARVNAYKEFRNRRIKTQDPFKLVPLLHRYSEVGDAYTKQLIKLIKNNNLTKYDSYTIDKKYLKNKTIELESYNHSYFKSNY